MKQGILIAAALVAGFVGGLFGARVARPAEHQATEPVIRARSFELLDETGQVISYWGFDETQNAVLTFGKRWPPDPDNPNGRPKPVGPLDKLANQRASIGVIGDAPFLTMRGADGKTRVRLMLNFYAKPVLVMEDETDFRLALGVEQSDTPGPEDNNWNLRFNPESAKIGLFSEKKGGETFVRGYFNVKPDKVKYPDKNALK